MIQPTTITDRLLELSNVRFSHNLNPIADPINEQVKRLLIETAADS